MPTTIRTGAVSEADTLEAILKLLKQQHREWVELMRGQIKTGSQVAEALQRQTEAFLQQTEAIQEHTAALQLYARSDIRRPH